MNKFIWMIFFSIYLSSCAQYHAVESTLPCFYPYEKYSFQICDTFFLIVDDTVYAIPPDFITDFASIPRPLWFLYAPHESEIIAASVAHDYLYTQSAHVERKYADDVFYNMLVKNGVSRGRAWLFWVGVRMFGWNSFHRR